MKNERYVFAVKNIKQFVSEETTKIDWLSRYHRQKNVLMVAREKERPKKQVQEVR